MLFTSITFIVFFLIIFVIYWFILNHSTRLQNGLLLIAGYIFYGWWDWRFLLLLIFSSAADFYLGQLIYKARNLTIGKNWLVVSLFINLGLLGFFKYFNFFANSFTILFSKVGISVDQPTIHIILPVGLSFYTFQSLTYTIDIYKKRMEPTKDILNYFTFVAFFPQLVAGPIERARIFLPQFFQKRTFNYEMAKSGGKLILIGFFKKIVIADGLSVLVNTVYNNPHSYPGFPMVIATIFFAFQIYCDFSGYSDIAIGTAKLLGFNLVTNFNSPYLSRSLTEFWHRWHISLSTWFRDYVFIPLGGSRTTKLKASFNIFITFVLSGLWHGANWTFIIWGAIHGLVLIIEKAIKTTNRLYRNYFVNILHVLITFSIVCLAWIFFRSNSLSDAFYIISKMFSDIGQYSNFTLMSLKFRGIGLEFSDLYNCCFFLVILTLIELLQKNEAVNKFVNANRAVRWGGYYFLLIMIVLSSTKNPAGNFIYFQF